MPRFFCKKDNITTSNIIIAGGDAHHMTRVLRMKPGDEITICDMESMDYECKIISISDENVLLEIINSFKNTSEPSINITLYQALPKSDKLEFIIQKAVELGVTEIVPFESKFCIAKGKDFTKKLDRYNKIAFEAAKQSGRGIIPTVSNILSFNDAIKRANNGILYYEHGGISTNNLINKTADNVSVFIGSEGGFSAEEVQFAIDNGISIGSLGRLILRCETAPIVAISLILNQTENI